MQRIFICLMLLISGLSHAQPVKDQSVQADIFKEFSEAHDWVSEYNDVFEVNTSFLAKGSKGEVDTQNSTLFLHKSAKVIYMAQKGQPVLMLNHPLGVWVTKQDQIEPLKVSGAYTVYGIINIEDIIGLDLRKTYNLEKNMGRKALLKAKKRNAVYPYILISKVGPNKFEAEFKDHTRKSIKQGSFTVAKVNGFKIIKTATYKDLVINTDRYTTYTIHKITKSKVPVAAMDPGRFKMIFSYIR